MKKYRLFVFFIATVLLLFTASLLPGAPLSEQDAIEHLTQWMDGHPIMGVAAGREIKTSGRFPENGSDYTFFIVAFDPSGYAVLNSDDSLPLVVTYSADSSIDLADRPDNAFRLLLLTYAAETALRLKEPDKSGNGTEPSPPRKSGRGPLGQTTFGPYLETSWSQANPYNMFCPETPGAGYGYNGRVPAGCVPVAYGQIMRHHSWPPYGEGSHSYDDTEGTIQGSHSAVFETPFNWSAMQTNYNLTQPSQPGETDVADLIYRLGVATEINYEAEGSGSSVKVLGSRMSQFLFYESPVFSSDLSALTPLINSDLSNGRPAVVSVNGHAIVADGLLEDNGNTSYHLNYGWGGHNNGWWENDEIPDGPFMNGCASILPALMALPIARELQVFSGDPFSLEWWVPATRTGEIASLLLKQLVQQPGEWTTDAESFNYAESDGWELNNSGHNDGCWFAGPNGPRTLTLSDIFVPSASCELKFWMQYKLGNGLFLVSVSDDGGQNYALLYQKTNNSSLSWALHTVSLKDYAGKQIRIRFELTKGSSYYPTGGVWLDDLSIENCEWLRWTALTTLELSDEPFLETNDNEFPRQPYLVTLMKDAPAGTYTLAAVLEDNLAIQHRMSPPLTLTIKPLFTYREEPDNTVTITDYTGSNATLKIPSVLSGKEVTGIAADAFTGSTLKNVIVPASVRSLESGAFSGVNDLEGIMFVGPPPSAPSGALPNGVTVFYLPGNSGWGNSLAERPALLWNPGVIADSSFGISNERFGFTITGTPSIPLRVQAADNLFAPQWQNLTNTSLNDAGTAVFTDPSLPAPPSRFYRFAWPTTNH